MCMCVCFTCRTTFPIYYDWFCLSAGGEGRDDDYVDIDQHDEYVDPDELIGGDGGSSTGDPPTPASPSALYDLYKPLPSELHVYT